MELPQNLHCSSKQAACLQTSLKKTLSASRKRPRVMQKMQVFSAWVPIKVIKYSFFLFCFWAYSISLCFFNCFQSDSPIGWVGKYVVGCVCGTLPADVVFVLFSPAQISLVVFIICVLYFDSLLWCLLRFRVASCLFVLAGLSIACAQRFV